jgi:hypothetical protein
MCGALEQADSVLSRRLLLLLLLLGSAGQLAALCAVCSCAIVALNSTDA